MADWFIATEGVKVVKDSASLWPQIITAVSSAGAALGGVCLTHRFTRRREERATADKTAAERLYLVTELAFLLDLSEASGDWRVLPPHQIFRIRSLEADHVGLISRISKFAAADDDSYGLTLNFECFQAAVRAFILAARLRREAGLPDSAQLSDRSGILWELRAARRRTWSTVARLRRAENKVFESFRGLYSHQEIDQGKL